MAKKANILIAETFLLLGCASTGREGGLSENALQAKELGISSSPAFLWENRYLFFDPKRLGELPGFEDIDIELTGSCN